MNTIILDPTDPTRAIIGSHTEPVFGAYAGHDGVLKNIHRAVACQGQTCVIHNPTDHHMREWNLLWRGDRGIFERTCPHGIGHPDPDQYDFWALNNRKYEAIHSCDGCCKEPS